MSETNKDTVLTPGRRGSWYQRLFARALASEGRTRLQGYDDRRLVLLGDLHGDVLEIGPGPGTNLPYYARDVRWHGLEPNPAMLPYLQREARRLGLSVQVSEGYGEHVDAPDNSFDAVVSTFVLCSVADPQRTMREIRRVLKPGGRFVFIEHVAAPRASGLRRVQRLVKPVWKVFGDGCHPDRETWAAIESAGFTSVELEHFRVTLPIMSPHIAGVAVK